MKVVNEIKSGSNEESPQAGCVCNSGWKVLADHGNLLFFVIAIAYLGTMQIRKQIKTKLTRRRLIPN